MSHVPLDKRSGRKRPVNEHEAGKLRRQKEKADWEARNGKRAPR